MSSFKINKKNNNFSSNQASKNNLGNIPLQVTEYNVKDNSATGVNLNTGEVMTINMVSQADFAAYFANHSVHTTSEARKRNAEQQLLKQPPISQMLRNMTDADGATLMFQNVKQTPKGLQARWVEALTTCLNECVEKAMVNFGPLREAQNDSGTLIRNASIAFVDKAQPLSATTVLSALSQKFNGKDTEISKPSLEGNVNPRPIITIVDSDNNTLSGTFFGAFDKEEKKFEQSVEALFKKPLQTFNVEVGVAAAAILGLQFEELTFDDKVDLSERENELKDIYLKAQNGEIPAVIIPSYNLTVMKFLSTNIAEQEKRMQNNPNAICYAGKRGYFEADISLRQSQNDGYEPQIQLKTAFPTGFLVAENDAKFVSTNVQDLGNKAVNNLGNYKELSKLFAAEKSNDAAYENDHNSSFEYDNYDDSFQP